MKIEFKFLFRDIKSIALVNKVTIALKRYSAKIVLVDKWIVTLLEALPIVFLFWCANRRVFMLRGTMC